MARRLKAPCTLAILAVHIISTHSGAGPAVILWNRHLTQTRDDRDARHEEFLPVQAHPRGGWGWSAPYRCCASTCHGGKSALHSVEACLPVRNRKCQAKKQTIDQFLSHYNSLLTNFVLCTSTLSSVSHFSTLIFDFQFLSLQMWPNNLLVDRYSSTNRSIQAHFIPSFWARSPISCRFSSGKRERLSLA